MNDAAVRQILDEIQKSKDELKNTIIAIDELERNGTEETKIIKGNSQPATPTQNLIKEYDSLEELNCTEKLDHQKFPKENKKGKLHFENPSSIKLRPNSSSTHTKRGK
ncbi:hypothetical protein JTB14_020748 [Gonioctena quinquepunctata]|nr:hypothetical protein JTB14_020748 [Gonioctena quinquepunctata]